MCVCFSCFCVFCFLFFVFSYSMYFAQSLLVSFFHPWHHRFVGLLGNTSKWTSACLHACPYGHACYPGNRQPLAGGALQYRYTCTHGYTVYSSKYVHVIMASWHHHVLCGVPGGLQAVKAHIDTYMTCIRWSGLS